MVTGNALSLAMLNALTGTTALAQTYGTLTSADSGMTDWSTMQPKTQKMVQALTDAIAAQIIVGAAGGAQRPTLVGDEQLVWRCNDASSPLVNYGSASSANLTAFGSPAGYQQPGPFGGGVLPSTSASAVGWKGGSGTSVPNTLSASAWIFPMSSSGTQIVLCKDNSDTVFTHTSFVLDVEAAVPKAYITTANGSDFSLAAGGPLALNAWHQLCATYTSGDFRLYVDGVEVASSTLPTGNVTNYSTSWHLGGRESYSESFVGRICEVRLNPSVLSASTILSQYAEGLGLLTT